MTTTDELRATAKGLYPAEAAVELLCRAYGGRFARSGNSWINESSGRARFDPEQVTPDTIGVLSGGEKRILRIAASLAGGAPVDLNDALPGLDTPSLALVVAAISHAGGTPQWR